MTLNAFLVYIEEEKMSAMIKRVTLLYNNKTKTYPRQSIKFRFFFFFLEIHVKLSEHFMLYLSDCLSWFIRMIDRKKKKNILFKTTLTTAFNVSIKYIFFLHVVNHIYYVLCYTTLCYNPEKFIDTVKYIILFVLEHHRIDDILTIYSGEKYFI